jgi:hypothetical protein
MDDSNSRRLALIAKRKRLRMLKILKKRALINSQKQEEIRKKANNEENKIKILQSSCNNNFLTGHDILNLNDEELKFKISYSIYPHSNIKTYDIGDSIYGYPMHRRNKGIKNLRRFLAKCKLYHHFCPNSLITQYLLHYNENKNLKDKINEKQNINSNLNLISDICNKLDTHDRKPQEDELVVSLRLGDMIELERPERPRRQNGKDLALHGGTFYTPVGGTRNILSISDIINELKKYNLNKVILTGGKSYFPTGCHRSIEYLRNIIILLQEKNIECYWYSSYNPDDDFIFISRSKYLLAGPGGFCTLTRLISNHRNSQFINS